MQLDNDTMSEAGSLVSDMFDSHHRSFSASSKKTNLSKLVRNNAIVYNSHLETLMTGDSDDSDDFDDEEQIRP